MELQADDSDTFLQPGYVLLAFKFYKNAQIYLIADKS